jgi:heme A synthase
MLHRASAAIFLIFATGSAYWAASSSAGRVRSATLAGFGFMALQIALGIANVIWALPVPLREAHAANACLTFLAFIAAFVFATLDGTGPVRVRGRARAPGRVNSTAVSRL